MDSSELQVAQRPRPIPIVAEFLWREIVETFRQSWVSCLAIGLGANQWWCTAKTDHYSQGAINGRFRTEVIGWDSSGNTK
jgi:hypothetical protein